MESLDSNFIETDNSGLDSIAKGYLLTSAKWGRFLAIVGFVFIGLFVVMAFTAGSLFATLGAMSPMGGALQGAAGVAFTIYFLVIGGIWFFPTWYLFRFSTNAISALTNEGGSLTDAFSNLKSAFKFWGILTIIVLSFYGLALLVMLLGFLAR